MTAPAAASITKTAAATGGGILLATHLPLVAGLVTALLFALFLGVVLPAVWSTRPARRSAALKVLQEILEAIGRPAGTGDYSSASEASGSRSARRAPARSGRAKE